MVMAQNRTITDILQELKKDYNRVLLKAVGQTTDTACEDVYKFSISVLERYYENYEPSTYNRTQSLGKATYPIADVKIQGNMIISTFGVGYDPDILESVAASSYYEASRKYGNVDDDWVIQNYLMGIHPATNGSSNPDTVVYIPWIDPVSPDKTLKKYLKWYRKKFQNNVTDYLLRYISK